MRIVLPEKVSYLIRELQNAGHEAYAVGGCVRDSLLFRTPKDWDITTSADPYEVKELFRRTVDTGIKHGTVTVLIGEDGFEITTYRLDGEYEDSRHPKQVTFTKSLEEDLKRRDFTINAMAYNETDGLVDLFGGCEDLQAGVIRCVGDPAERFHEDALRILRAVRFSAQLGFSVEEKTKAAVLQRVKQLNDISAERIRDELNKLLLSPSPERLLEAKDLGIIAPVLPKLILFLEDRENAERILKGLADFKNEETHEPLVMIWATLLNAAAFYHEPAAGKTSPAEVADGCSERRREFTRKILRDLKFDNDTINTAGRLAEYSTLQPKAEAFYLRRQMNRMGEELFDRWLEFLKGDRFPDGRRISEEQMRAVEEEVKKIRSAPYCISLKQLKVNGEDLMSVGAKQGISLGKTLAYLLERVLENQELNRKDILLQLAAEYIKGQE